MGLHDWVAPTAWILTYAAMFLVVRPAGQPADSAQGPPARAPPCRQGH
jgi:hypothetical protein